MKKIVLLVTINLITILMYSQEATYSQVKEYSTVYLKIYYQANVIQYDKKGWSKSPIISMPDGRYAFLYDATDVANPKEFRLLNEILNYMAKFGWEVKNMVVLPYSGGTGGASSNDLINTSVYLEEIIFERLIKK